MPVTGLTTLPTKTDGSIGREKTTLPGSDPSPDLDYYETVDEHERAKTALVGVCDEVGKHDGSSAGSLVARVTALEAAGAGINQLTGDATAGPGGGSQAVIVTQARGLRTTSGGGTTLAMGALTDGQTLERSGTDIIGAQPFTHVAVIGNATLPAHNAIVSVDTTAVTAPGTLSLTLPTPVAGRCYFIFKTGGAYNETITLVRAASENIDGAAASRLLIDSDLEGSVVPTIAAWIVTSNGTDWFSLPMGRLVRHQINASAPVDTTHTSSAGFYIPGSTWTDTATKKLYMAMAAASLSNTVWDRVDAVDVLTIPSSQALPSKDRQCFVDTTSSAISLTLPAPTGRNAGRQFVITRTNASGTNAITLVRAASENINGAGSNFVLTGSGTAGYGRWHVVSDGTNWWVTGGTGLV